MNKSRRKRQKKKNKCNFGGVATNTQTRILNGIIFILCKYRLYDLENFPAEMKKKKMNGSIINFIQ